MPNPVFNTSGSYSTVSTQKGTYFLQSGSYSNITYQTSSYASGTAGAMKYSVHVKLERLG